MSGKIYVALISHDYKSNYFNRFFIGRRFDFVAEALYAADYRKQSDVVREFVKQLDGDWLEVDTKEYGRIYVVSEERIYELAAEFGAEVE